MRRKSDLKDWVRKLMDENPIVTFGPNARVVLRCARTGKCHARRIRQNWWDDTDFRWDYALLRAPRGLRSLYC
jgi:hypothetical protein